MSIILSSFFFFFSSFALISAIMVIISDNPIYSALYLILVFFNSSILILLLDLEFLAFIFILIYIGAIMVLVLFIIMMLDIKNTTVDLRISYYYGVSGFFLILLSSELLYFLNQDLSIHSLLNDEYFHWFSLLWEVSTIRLLGMYLYTSYSYCLIIAGLILLVAMLGAISLLLEKSNVGQFQQLAKQVNTNPNNSIFYLS